ncbi:Hydrolase, NUDIX family [Alteracholeplasma palmae J233]|uniref:Hydrolase, NUDIX family n=1 Tax=Alteracholeplasma palmae (strain ATCC 49389 / J233) TaxID=1318466 RepID=U4KLB9_ALTPJ|nr:NUDIX domain-containing protein [Alteracholeplasma palmae]CCV64602.1 Hydrolase, NUDIX family [Alteracholeplasma palmae J233]
MKELWDAYDKDINKQELTLVRGEKIPKGYYHLVSEIIVYHKDKIILLTQRSFDKKIAPGLYEASSSGSVLKGETPLEAAKRELYEETGIKVTELIPTYKEIHEEFQTIFYGFIAKVDIQKDSIVLQKEETINYIWLSKEELLKLIQTDKYIPSHIKRLKEGLEKLDD